MVIGIPVYLHYCGGELEKVNYVIKGDSCCGGMEDDTEESDSDCCKDENLVLKSTTDFTLKQFHNYDYVKNFTHLFFLDLPFSSSISVPKSFVFITRSEYPPPRVQNSLVISTSVLRI
jgi:hypothetical protein